MIKPISLLLTLVAATACARNAADGVRPVEEPTTPGPTTTGAPAPPSSRAFTVTGVSIDPDILSACGISDPTAFFEFDSAAVTPSEGGVLDQVAQCLGAGGLKDRNVELVGHADPRGSDQYNDRLGMSRAESVQRYLVGRGLAAGRLSVRSMGEARADASDPGAWPYERRVDIRLAATK
jgi:outer membrane protein OmpA-like peptidoglycan-associated protein